MTLSIRVTWDSICNLFNVLETLKPWLGQGILMFDPCIVSSPPRYSIGRCSAPTHEGPLLDSAARQGNTLKLVKTRNWFNSNAAKLVHLFNFQFWRMLIFNFVFKVSSHCTDPRSLIRAAAFKIPQQSAAAPLVSSTSRLTWNFQKWPTWLQIQRQRQRQIQRH